MALRIGVVGVGPMGADHARRIATVTSNAELVGVADIRPERAQAVSDKYGVKIYPDGKSLVDSPDVDAVIVATRPHEYHEEFVLEAIKLGKYVFCEKPLTISAERCRKIVDAEMAGGKRLVQIGFMRRFDKGYIETKKLLESGKFGEPLIVHAAHRNESVGLDYDNTMPVVETVIHDVDVLRYVLGEDYVSGSCYLPPKQTRHTHANLHDPQIVTLNTKSGIYINIEIFVNNQMGYDINNRVVCEEGEIALRAPAYTRIKFHEAESEHIPADFIERFRQAYDDEMQAFVNGVLADKLTGPTSWDGLAAQTICDVLGKSRDGGKAELLPIELPETPDFYKN